MVASDLTCLPGLWRCSIQGPGLSRNAERKRGLLFFVLTVLHFLECAWSQSELQPFCPASCECSEAAKTVKCVNKNLTDVPQTFPSYVENLIITNNIIVSLRDGAFNQSLKNLSHLNLNGNHIQKLENDSLSYLSSLKQLDLSNNELQIMGSLSFGRSSSSLQELNLSNSFKNESLIYMLGLAIKTGALNSLEKLKLSGNDIMFLPNGTFSSVPNLKHLDLSNNSLMGLSADLFMDLSNLVSLNLSHNSLKWLTNPTLFTQRRLEIYLDDNNWVCNCFIEDFATWLKTTKIVNDPHSLMCSDPENLKGMPVLELQISELECPIPEENTSLQTSYVFLGIVLALIGVIFLLVLYLNRKGIKKWMYNIRDACRDHMEGYHYRYEINADPRLTNLSTNSDV
ncbi:hypothetical protein GDO86_009842 [Hymenochirus boettgeri]|uniref:Trophoblast glycoprotein n=1 Tax=Hymenochirus boettgeri TaxID=247094 RepID=A0A8T2JM80_9PIPI|nr:hypothetical protein GDO86_009842 [Hymenochirus boettgeri]